MHQPVLIKEVLEYLNPQPGENFIDCTFGFGGHSQAILKRISPQGKILGIELNKKTLEHFKPQPGITLTQGSFADLKTIVEKEKFGPVKGILFDLGISSWQIQESGRGFSFQKDEPLDMRTGQGELAAKEIINQWSEEDLIKIFQDYGEERYSRSIAGAICQKRKIEPIKTTSQLVEIIARSVPGKYRRARIHWATRVFQALRIAVNNELANLEKVLPEAVKILTKNGRLAVISFHSLEDRIVKHYFRQAAQQEFLKILTKKPIRPTQEEVEINPRSRSAKLRAVSII
ncbi:MAG: 16S rRNA (cytosine(1402)-N(4))-methyltransferase [Parcubacteria group bacterium]|jgi:16S rRNA (cytosine1402-N4)-methyltransferase|nr:16S rRNA (cytosine(1402)-N(4))-methyltransferase [Parcubacteria group bacterium]|tara:strand:+ start:10063 stop:10926 length:864 start_codon:yes stop_codon:yes gene_type:complete